MRGRDSGLRCRRMVVALVFAFLVVFVGVTGFFISSDQMYRLTPEQEGRINRDNELRAAFHEFREEFGRTPTVRELWLYSPPPEKMSQSMPKEAT